MVNIKGGGAVKDHNIVIMHHSIKHTFSVVSSGIVRLRMDEFYKHNQISISHMSDNTIVILLRSQSIIMQRSIAKFSLDILRTRCHLVS